MSNPFTSNPDDPGKPVEPVGDQADSNKWPGITHYLASSGYLRRKQIEDIVQRDLDLREVDPDLFSREDRHVLLDYFFQELLRTYQSDRYIDTTRLREIANLGLLGEGEDVKKIASAVVAQRTQDFQDWNSMADTNYFENGLLFLINEEWCDTAGIAEGLNAIRPEHRQRKLEIPLMVVATEMETKAVQAKLNATILPASGGSKAPRL